MKSPYSAFPTSIFGSVQELERVVREAQGARVACKMAGPDTGHTIFYGNSYDRKDEDVSNYSLSD